MVCGGGGLWHGELGVLMTATGMTAAGMTANAVPVPDSPRSGSFEGLPSLGSLAALVSLPALGSLETLRATFLAGGSGRDSPLRLEARELPGGTEAQEVRCLLGPWHKDPWSPWQGRDKGLRTKGKEHERVLGVC